MAGPKRKRSPTNELLSQGPTSRSSTANPAAAAPQVPSLGALQVQPRAIPSFAPNEALVNYLVAPKGEKLPLIDESPSGFVDVLAAMDGYEEKIAKGEAAILQRKESLAVHLGAKLVGPLVLKSLEKLFDGSIHILQPAPAHWPKSAQSPVSWLEIVTFSRTNPSEFVLSRQGVLPYDKSCRFWVRGAHVEISEDDHRLIMSGVPERLLTSQPSLEDEAAEIGTLNILEARLGKLIRRADAVASKARQLNYHLKGRKTAILKQQATKQFPQPDVVQAAAYFSTGKPGNSTPPSVTPSNEASRPSITPGSEDSLLQQDLLAQFLSNSHRNQPDIETPTEVGHSVPQTDIDFENRLSNDLSEPEGRQVSEIDENQHRFRMSVRVDKLSRGDSIIPPCDRCRRLKFECTKHLTACSACTKKHAKCSWKDLTDEELDHIKSQSQFDTTPITSPNEANTEMEQNGELWAQAQRRSENEGPESPLTASKRREKVKLDVEKGVGVGASEKS